jgi:RNA polymerase sigma-70 factor (ECF subfamily)
MHHLSHAVKQRTSFCYQTRLARHDGYVRTVETSGSVPVSKDGAPQALVGHVVLVADWALPVLQMRDGMFTEGDMAVGLLARTEEAYAYAFAQYVSLVRRVAGVLLQDRTQVDDVVQSVFESLWLHPERFDSTRGSLAAYLRVQARSRSLDLLRSEASRASRALRFSATAETIRNDQYDDVFEPSGLDVRTALDLLPTTEREVIELAYFGGMSYRNVAAHLDLPEGTVKGRIRSGLERLRRLDCIKNLGQGMFE